MTALTPLARHLVPRFSWVRDPAVAKIVKALAAAAPDGARFVGGCVRDSLLGEAPKDVDIATTLAPEDVIAALSRAGLAAAPTGIEHGTVTAIADHKGVEVTTLRSDVSTDGRRAVVAFTRDWRRDAERRDFTINAIYLTPALEVFDPVGGADDLAGRRVRFIGAPEDRIREDYLRILRFFRFSARFAARFDDAGLKACAALKDGVRRLSAERIGDEFGKLLSLPAPQDAVEAMRSAGILTEVWPAPPRIETLARLKAIDPEAAAALGLAALYGAAGEGIDARLRLSNAQGSRRRAALQNAPLVYGGLSDKGGRALLYRIGAAAFRDALLLAESEAPEAAAPFAALRALADRWTPPRRPFSGSDALARGVPQGPKVAEVINAAEARWIEEDFPPRERAMEIFGEEAARAISKG